MKIIIVVGILSTISLTCSTSIHREMMNLISLKPVKEQFKLWHYVMQKPYDLESEEAKLRFINFKKNIDKYEEINNKNLGFTVGLGLFSDMDFSSEEVLSIMTEGSSHLNMQTKFDFDLMADNDDELTSENLFDKSEKDWSELYKTSYPFVESTGKENLIFCSNHTFEQGLAHVINAHAKINNMFRGNASAQFYRNCVDDGKENCRSTTAFQKFLRFESIPLEKDLPWTTDVGSCVNPPSTSAYEVEWTFCAQFSSNKCNEHLVNGFIKQGPYLSKIANLFEIINYKSGVVPTDNCYSSSIAAIVVEIDQKFVKALLTFGPKVADNGYVRIKNENLAHPEISCGLKSYAMSPDVFVEN